MKYVIAFIFSSVMNWVVATYFVSEFSLILEYAGTAGISKAASITFLPIQTMTVLICYFAVLFISEYLTSPDWLDFASNPRPSRPIPDFDPDE